LRTQNFVFSQTFFKPLFLKKSFMIIRTTRVDALPAKRQEFIQAMTALASEILNEMGCRECSFFQDTEDENRFTLKEKWANQQALDKHLQSDIYTVLVGAINLLTKNPEINKCTTESLEGDESERE
jgi:quinol monooxygenase YgiN